MSVLLNNLPLCPQTDQTALQPRVSVSTSRNRMDRGHALSRLGVCIVQLSRSMAAELHSTRRGGGLARCHLANRSISWAWAWSQRSHGGPPSSSSTIHFYGTQSVRCSLLLLLLPLLPQNTSPPCPSSVDRRLCGQHALCIALNQAGPALNYYHSRTEGLLLVRTGHQR